MTEQEQIEAAQAAEQAAHEVAAQAEAAALAAAGQDPNWTAGPDNIDIDLTNVELEPPKFDNVTVRCLTGQLTVDAKDPAKKRLVIPLVLQEPATSTLGKVVQPGFKTTVSILMDEVGKWTAARGAEELGRFKAAVLKLDKVEGSFGSLAPLRGQPVKVTFEVDRGGYQTYKRFLRADK
jgi:hypothetical protein